MPSWATPPPRFALPEERGGLFGGHGKEQLIGALQGRIWLSAE